MPYNREAAVAYAKEWAYRRNPRFYDFSNIGGDCTNFASQCILAGGARMNYTPIYGWYYNSVNSRSPSWTGVNELFRFLVSNEGIGPKGRVVPLSQIQNGDIVQIRFRNADTFGHTPVVVDRGQGTPDTVMVAAHSNDSDCRSLSTYNYAQLRPVNIYF